MVTRNPWQEIKFILINPSKWLIVTLTTVFTVVTFAETESFTGVKENLQHLEIGMRTDHKSLLKIGVETATLDSTDANEAALSQFIAQRTKTASSTVVLSTDDASLLQKSLENNQLVGENFLAAPLNLQALADPVESKRSPFLKLIKNQVQGTIKSAKNDKIGILILTYTTAAETLFWIHSTQLSQFERSSNAIYSVALALVFGLNKDAWSLTTRPIQKFFRQILKPANSSPRNTKEFAARFLGNLTLATVVTAARIPLLSLDDMISKGIQLQYFTMPLLLTVVSTTALFTWSEHLAMVDETTHPITKFIFRRTAEMRSILLGTFAATAALLLPSQYGLTPWITLAGVGVAGSLLYFNTDSISKWLETNPFLVKLKNRFSLQCRNLFAINGP